MSRDTTDHPIRQAGQASRPSPLLVRYSEIGLKGLNRPKFERTLTRNLESALGGRACAKVERIRGRLLVRTTRPAEEAMGAILRVFGVASVSAAAEVPRDLDAMAEAIEALCDSALARQFAGHDEVGFRVSVNRADKSFPASSSDMERDLGRRLQERHPQLVARLRDPELNLEIDIRNEGCWAFAARETGPGGLPVGSAGRVLALLSGGIDSPVAAWQAMKRGLRVDFAYFHSFPHVGPQSREKVIRQVENLVRWEPAARLFVVPFSDYQMAVREHCPERYWTVLFRRGMQRIAGRLAWSHRCLALITGESIGQVASQTLENLGVIGEASRIPTLRPLVTYDKQETIALARRIGSYEISNLPGLDCCTVFQPAHPVLFGRVAEAREAEAALDIDDLVRNAVRSAEKLRFPEQT